MDVIILSAISMTLELSDRCRLSGGESISTKSPLAPTQIAEVEGGTNDVGGKKPRSASDKNLGGGRDGRHVIGMQALDWLGWRFE